MSCCGPMESGCCSSGCCGPRKGLFCKLKNWFKGGSNCDNYDSGCCDQPKGGLFCRLKNLFHKKKNNYCCATPTYYGGDCCNPCGGFDGGFAGGYGGGFGGSFGGCCNRGFGY